MDRQTRAALVTGGTAGIGLAIARRLLQDGYAVTICGRDAGRLNAAAQDLGQPECLNAVMANMAESEDVRRLLSSHFDRFGRVDVLVNNAGVGFHASISGKSERKLDIEMSVNLKAAHLTIAGCANALKKAAREHGKALIVNISSIAGKECPPNVAGYAATKAVLIALSRAAHAELSNDGIQVTALIVGFVDTPGSAWVRDVPRKRMLSDTDIAEAVAFLLRTSARCFVPEMMLTTAGTSAMGSGLDWHAVAAS